MVTDNVRGPTMVAEKLDAVGAAVSRVYRGQEPPPCNKILIGDQYPWMGHTLC